MNLLKGVTFTVCVVALMVVGASCIAMSGVVLFNEHLGNVAIPTKEVVINSQPCKLPTSTDNEVTR